MSPEDAAAVELTANIGRVETMLHDAAVGVAHLRLERGQKPVRPRRGEMCTCGAPAVLVLPRLPAFDRLACCGRFLRSAPAA